MKSVGVLGPELFGHDEVHSSETDLLLTKKDVETLDKSVNLEGRGDRGAVHVQRALCEGESAA